MNVYFVIEAAETGKASPHRGQKTALLWHKIKVFFLHLPDLLEGWPVDPKKRKKKKKKEKKKKKIRQKFLFTLLSCGLCLTISIKWPVPH